MNESSLLRMDHADACIDGHPQYSPRRPFQPLRARNPGPIFLRAAPPPRRGANACALSILHLSLHNLTAVIPPRRSGSSFLQPPRRFSPHKVARKRDPPLHSPRGGTRFCASAPTVQKIEATLFRKPLRNTVKPKHSHLPAAGRAGSPLPVVRKGCGMKPKGKLSMRLEGARRRRDSPPYQKNLRENERYAVLGTREGGMERPGFLRALPLGHGEGGRDGARPSPLREDNAGQRTTPRGRACR